MNIKLAIVILLLCVANSVNAFQICDDADTKEIVRVYFANGMNNEYSDRLLNMKKLSDLFSNSSYEFGIAENHDGSAITELIEAYRQKLNEPKTFWRWMANHSLAPDWFQNAYTERVSEIAVQQVQSNADLNKMLYGGYDEANNFDVGIINSLYVGKKVVIVAHSQGNLYANIIYQYLKDNYPEYRNSLGIVSVGTPSNHVNGPVFYSALDGNLGIAPYTTNSRDHVMNAIRAAAIFLLIDRPLPANVTYNQPFDFKNHAFINTYLAAFSGRIKRHVEDMISGLSFPQVLPVCQTEIPDFPKIVTLNAEYTNATTVNLVNLPGRIDSGKNLSVWTIWDWTKSGIVPACSSTEAGNEGVFNVGDVANFVGVSELNTHTEWVTYRKCAINSIGQISDGGVRIFRSTRR